MALHLGQAASSLSGKHSDQRVGLAAALGAFGMWGMLALYWYVLRGVPPLELLCHRIVWGTVSLALILLATGRLPQLRDMFRNTRLLGKLCVSSALISLNWFLFIWAVSQNRVLDSSLGYFINPLMTTLLGYVVFKDRFSRLQGIGIGLAALGVAWNVAAFGTLPVLSLFMALSFALYGVVRKLSPADSLCALMIETLIASPFALAFLLYHYLEAKAPVPGAGTVGLLMLGGPFTVIPLLMFGYAAQRVRLTVLGLCQYLSPTISFFLSIWVFHEPFSLRSLVTFACIWAGVAVFSWGGWLLAHPPGPVRHRT